MIPSYSLADILEGSSGRTRRLPSGPGTKQNRPKLLRPKKNVGCCRCCGDFLCRTPCVVLKLQPLRRLSIYKPKACCPWRPTKAASRTARLAGRRAALVAVPSRRVEALSTAVSLPHPILRHPGGLSRAARPGTLVVVRQPSGRLPAHLSGGEPSRSLRFSPVRRVRCVVISVIAGATDRV